MLGLFRRLPDQKQRVSKKQKLFGTFKQETKLNPQLHVQWRTQEFCLGGGVQQIQLRTERTGIWGAVAP